MLYANRNALGTMGGSLFASWKTPMDGFTHGAILIALATVVFVAGGCAFDAEDRCGENQVPSGDSMCQCAEGFALAADATTCEPAAEPPAEPSPGAGEACASDEECPETAGFCADGDDGGYCTTADCTSTAECETGWYCDMEADRSFCHEPPSGLGMSCANDSDCSGFDASHCETFQINECIIVGCTADAPCPSGYVCCDLRPTGFFDDSQCIEGTACPIGEML